MVTKVASDRQGIQSIEVGFRLLRVLAATNRPMMLRDIAKGAGMPAAKAHRYMVSFMRIGLVEQDSASGRYDLGSYALDLGLSGLGRLDPVRLAGPILDTLCEEIQETVALAVWGTHGATIVRIVDAGAPVTITLRAGTVLPLSNSATGRAFAAFFRSPYLKQLLDEAARRALTLGPQHRISRASGWVAFGAALFYRSTIADPGRSPPQGVRTDRGRSRG